MGDDTNERKTYIRSRNFCSRQKSHISYKYRGNRRVHPVTLQEYVCSSNNNTIVYIYICFVDRSNEERRARVVVY